MRASLLLLVLAACPSSSTNSSCMVDTDCGGGEVCTRNMECLAPSDVYSVKVTWTIRGSAANASTCAASPDFYIQFDGPEQRDTFGYEPVPCDPGQFTVDKLPKRFTQAEIGIGDRYPPSRSAA